jgi:hypothetical protein
LTDLRHTISEKGMWKELGIKFFLTCILGAIAGFFSHQVTDILLIRIITGTLLPIGYVSAIVLYFYYGRK